jgi:hypothetical protein
MIFEQILSACDADSAVRISLGMFRYCGEAVSPASEQIGRS